MEIPIDALALTGAIESIRLVGDLDGTFYIDDVRLVAENPPSATAILETRSKGTPETFTLSQNYPNPFNPGTTIRFDLHRSQEIELAIYNLAAQKVATLVQGYRQAGSYSVRWDGGTDAGLELASGVYFYRFTGWKHGSCCG